MLATKVHGRMHEGPGGGGLSRKAIVEQLDASLRRLGTDYLDVYYIHRYDEHVPVEETMETLHEVVRAGKVRYLGASSMWAWQIAKMQTALARVLSKPVVACPLVGATKPRHLEDAVAALDIELTEAETQALEEPYTAQDNYWW